MKRDMGAALNLCEQCCHEEAVWLSSFFGSQRPEDEREALRRFQSSSEVRALCFAGLVCSLDLNLLQLAAENDYAFAQSSLASCLQSREWATKAAEQGERDGFKILGFLEPEPNKAVEYFSEAARLGDVESMHELAKLCPVSDPAHFDWLGRAARLNFASPFVEACISPVKLYMATKSNPSIVFVIGKYFHGHINAPEQVVFGEPIISYFDIWVAYDDDMGDDLVTLVLNAAKFADHFFVSQCLGARRAVDNWILIAIRCGVVKDVRRLIAHQIWQDRTQGRYSLS